MKKNYLTFSQIRSKRNFIDICNEKFFNPPQLKIFSDALADKYVSSMDVNIYFGSSYDLSCLLSFCSNALVFFTVSKYNSNMIRFYCWEYYSPLDFNKYCENAHNWLVKNDKAHLPLDFISFSKEYSPDEDPHLASRFSCFDVRRPNEYASPQDVPVPSDLLFDPLIYENECAVLFADANVGKSILAVQIAEQVANEIPHNVIYFDFELSPQQFAVRYHPEHQFPDNFIRASLSFENFSDDIDDYQAYVFNEMKNVIIDQKAKFVVIDNLSSICLNSESSVEASRLMCSLIQLKTALNLTILVVAHSPKRNPDLPISLNSLAGSRRIANFADSIFAIGKSALSPSVRYIKQLKSRNDDIRYDEDNVLLCHIEFIDYGLRFVEDGNASEAELLHRPPTKGPSKQTLQRVKDLHEKGKSCRQIASELGISHTSVRRQLERINDPTFCY